MTAAGLAGSAPPRTRGPALAGLALLLLLGLFYLCGGVSDLAADASSGIPADHYGTFTSLARHSFAQASAATPGTASYISVLERGYALHELTFALLFLLILAIPFRRRQRWAWWAAWIPMIANLGYTFTFGIHDHAILTRSLIADSALPALLLAHIPALLPRPRRPDTAGSRTQAAPADRIRAARIHQGPARSARPGRAARVPGVSGPGFGWRCAAWSCWKDAQDLGTA